MNNYFIDSHAHIYEEYYDDIDSIIEKSLDSNIKYIINAGCDRKSNEEIIANLNNPHLFGVIGIHPENVHEYQKEDLDFVEANLKNKKILGIGEIGLDYHYDKDSKEKQKALFEYQLSLAEKYSMPVVIHSREATQDTIDILKKYHVKGVIHSFSGSREVANIYLKMGFLLGINGVITFKNSNIKDVYKDIPLESIILETDSPYLTPHPFRGEKNDPSHIKDIAEFVANLKGISMDELAEVTNKNIERLFGKLDAK